MKLSANYTEFSGYFCHTDTHKSCREGKRGNKHKDKKNPGKLKNFMLKNEVFFSLLEFEKRFTWTSYKLQRNAM